MVSIIFFYLERSIEIRVQISFDYIEIGSSTWFSTGNLLYTELILASPSFQKRCFLLNPTSGIAG